LFSGLVFYLRFGLDNLSSQTLGLSGTFCNLWKWCLLDTSEDSQEGRCGQKLPCSIWFL